MEKVRNGILLTKSVKTTDLLLERQIMLKQEKELLRFGQINIDYFLVFEVFQGL